MGEGPASSFFRRCGCQGRCSALPAAVCFQNDKRGCDFPDSLRKVTLKTICRARKPPFRNCVTASLFALSAAKYQHRRRTRQRPSERRGFSSDKKPERAAPTARGAVPASLLLVVATSHQPLAPASILSSSSRQSAATRDLSSCANSSDTLQPATLGASSPDKKPGARSAYRSRRCSRELSARPSHQPPAPASSLSSSSRQSAATRDLSSPFSFFSPSSASSFRVILSRAREARRVRDLLLPLPYFLLY